MLTFDPSDWNTRKPVTVSSVDNKTHHPDDRRQVVISNRASEGGYDGITRSQTVVVTDDDPADDSDAYLCFRDNLDHAVFEILERPPSDTEGLSLTAAERIAERIQTEIDALETKHGGASIPLSAWPDPDLYQLWQNALAHVKGESLPNPNDFFGFASRPAHVAGTIADGTYRSLRFFTESQESLFREIADGF